MDDLKKIRNMGIMAHIDAGKTTTTERILYYSGKVHRIGEVDEGTSTMDWMPQEQERGITIVAAATTLYWNDHKINLIDTPGHVDFTVEVERSLRVLDGAILVVCGVGGVEAQTETVWKQAEKNKIPRFIYINKLDRMGADFEAALKDIHEKLNKKAVPIQWPLGTESDFHGILDLLEGKYLSFDSDNDGEMTVATIPDEYVDIYEDKRAHLIEYLADFDDQIMNDFLEGKEIEKCYLKKTLRKLTISQDIMPVYCGSSLKNKGVQPLLDGIVDYLPNPLDIPAAQAHDHKDKEKIIECPTDSSAHLSALAFKIAYDPFVGKLVYTRIYSGKFEKGQKLFNSTHRKKERVGRILRMHANKQEEVETAYAGDIVALSGMKWTRTGDTFCNTDMPLLLEVIQFPEPVISMAIEARGKAEAKQLDEVLERLQEEDPTLKVSVNNETGQKLLSGMGELHLEIIKDRILREEKLNVRMGQPQVAYRETVRNDGQSSIVVEREIGGTMAFAGVDIKVSPRGRGEGNQISIAPEIIEKDSRIESVIQEGLEIALNHGSTGIYPMNDLLVEITGIQIKEDSFVEGAFHMAVNQVFEKALAEAGTVLLEPIMKIEVSVPEEYNGEVIGDLNSRKGKITNLISRLDERIIHGEVPLKELFGYATVLRSLTKGRGAYSMEPLMFAEVSAK